MNGSHSTAVTLDFLKNGGACPENCGKLVAVAGLTLMRTRKSWLMERDNFTGHLEKSAAGCVEGTSQRQTIKLAANLIWSTEKFLKLFREAKARQD